MQARDPRTGRPGDRRAPGHATGRPQFGVGPIARVTPSPLVAREPTNVKPYATAPPRPGFGLPNLRRNVCPHFYMTGSRGAIPIQAPHLLKALIRQDAERQPLPAPRRRPPRPGLRQRRLPDAAVQPVRLLRGRADPRVTGAGRTPARRPPPMRAYDGRAARARRPRPVRDPPRARPDARPAARARRPAAGGPRRARRAGPTARAACSRSPAAPFARPACASARRPSRTSSRYRERIVVDGRPIDAATFARLVAEVLPVADRVARRLGRRRPSSSC